jgi:hypothetical protein
VTSASTITMSSVGRPDETAHTALQPLRQSELASEPSRVCRDDGRLRTMYLLLSESITTVKHFEQRDLRAYALLC